MYRSICITCLFLLLSPHAAALDFGVGAKVGVNGVGVDLSLGLTENVNLRVSASQIDLEGEEETVTVGDSGADGDLDLEVDFDYGANGIFLDWHLFGGGFRVSAGMFKNNGAAKGSAALQDAIIVDSENLDPSDFAGDINAEVNLGDSYQPYLGLGWGRGAGGDGGLSFSLDVGVALLETNVDYDANVNVNGTNALNQADLDRRLKALEKDTEDELDDYELWPVVALGINYAF
jgi:hypothetical protein